MWLGSFVENDIQVQILNSQQDWVPCIILHLWCIYVHISLLILLPFSFYDCLWRLLQTGAAYPESDVDDDDKKKKRRKFDDETESSEDESDEGADKQAKRRGRGRGGRELVRGFTDAELRRLIKSLRKFPRPQER